MPPRLSKLELKVMDVLWQRGPLCIRDVQEGFPKKGRPIYATVQTVLYRLEAKQAVRRARRVGNADIFEAVLSRDAVRARFIDELLGLFGGRAQPVVTQLVESGKLTLEDVRASEELLRKLARKDPLK
jgi:predicted transcriptional regulator